MNEGVRLEYIRHPMRGQIEIVQLTTSESRNGGKSNDVHALRPPASRTRQLVLARRTTDRVLSAPI